NIDPRDLHSFPTRRSSDLMEIEWVTDMSRGEMRTRTKSLLSLIKDSKTRVISFTQEPMTAGLTRFKMILERTEGSLLEEINTRVDRKSTRLNSSHVKISYA